MQILLPADAEIRRVQADDRRFYFSAAASLLPRKYGFALEDARNIVTHGIVTRGTEWRKEFRDKALIFEGPLHPSVREALGLKTISSVTTHLELSNPSGGHLGSLAFNRVTLRRIPAKNSEISEPYLFTADDSRWTPASYRFEALELEPQDVSVLYASDAEGTLHTVALRRGHAIVFGIPIFDIIAQHHVAPPYPDGYYATVVFSDLEPLEQWLITVCSRHFRDHGHLTVMIDRWPLQYRSAFTVRHDFDRRIIGISKKSFAQHAAILRLLMAYRRHGVRSTWFWRMWSYNWALARLVSASGHELALHTEAHDRQGFECEAEFFRSRGFRMKGFSAHGGAGSRGYLGHHQTQWAIGLGMSYGELLGSKTTLSSQSVILVDDIPRIGPLVMPAKHLGLDISMRPEGHCLETLLPEAQAGLSAGQQCLVMNHPDIHIDELIKLIECLNFDGVWHATLEEITDWSRSTAMHMTFDATRGATVSFKQALPYSARLHIATRKHSNSIAVPKGSLQVAISNDSAVSMSTFATEASARSAAKGQGHHAPCQGHHSA